MAYTAYPAREVDDRNNYAIEYFWQGTGVPYALSLSHVGKRFYIEFSAEDLREPRDSRIPTQLEKDFLQLLDATKGALGRQHGQAPSASRTAHASAQEDILYRWLLTPFSDIFADLRCAGRDDGVKANPPLLLFTLRSVNGQLTADAHGRGKTDGDCRYTPSLPALRPSKLLRHMTDNSSSNVEADTEADTDGESYALSPKEEEPEIAQLNLFSRRERASRPSCSSPTPLKLTATTNIPLRSPMTPLTLTWTTPTMPIRSPLQMMPAMTSPMMSVHC